MESLLTQNVCDKDVISFINYTELLLANIKKFEDNFDDEIVRNLNNKIKKISESIKKLEVSKSALELYAALIHRFYTFVEKRINLFYQRDVKNKYLYISSLNSWNEVKLLSLNNIHVHNGLILKK